jgi:hypothetical protein
MALASTTLAGAVAALDNIIPVTSATGFVAGSYVQVDSELMKIMAVSGTSISVFRGVRGTQAVAHGKYALVTVGTAAEFAAVTSGGTVGPFALKPRIYSYSDAGALTVAPGVHRIGAGQSGIIAYTLASPGYGDDGLEMIIESATAYAHYVTCTAGFQNDTTTSDVATLAAKVGASFTIKALGGHWSVLASSNIGASTVSVAFS